MPKDKDHYYSSIPILASDGSNYKTWKIKVKKWEKVTKIKTKKRAIELQLKLPTDGPIDIFHLTSHIADERLQSSRGVDRLLKVLDESFVPDRLQDRMQVFEEMRSLRRKEDESVIDFIQRYMIKFQDFRKLSESFAYDETTLALDLVNACNLPKDDKKLVSAQMVDPPCPKNVKKILKRVFSSKTMEKSKAEKSTASNQNNTENDNTSDIFSNIYEPKPEKTEDNPTFLAKHGKGRYRSTQNNRPERSSPYHRNFEGSKRNVVGQDGQVQQCHHCKCEFHFYKDCPHRNDSKQSQSHLSL